MEEYKMSAIGHLKSVFKSKNGTPRQSGLANQGRAMLRINKNVLNNPNHALENLEEFSHVWLIWVFHKNGQDAVKAKVSPPRLSGKRVGLFSTRSPHRPNPIGLSLARVEKVVGDTVFLLGVDIIDGTPILDIKPFIPIYDNPFQKNSTNQEIFENMDLNIEEEATYNKYDNDDEDKRLHPNKLDIPEQDNLEDNKDQDNTELLENIHNDATNQSDVVNESDGINERLQPDVEDQDIPFTPGWIGDPEDDLQVRFSSRSLRDLQTLQISDSQLVQDKDELVSIIRGVLGSDPRSVYRKNRCSDRLYYTTVDNVHVTAWFDSRHDLMEVVALQTLQTVNNQTNRKSTNLTVS